MKADLDIPMCPNVKSVRAIFGVLVGLWVAQLIPGVQSGQVRPAVSAAEVRLTGSEILPQGGNLRQQPTPVTHQESVKPQDGKPQEAEPESGKRTELGSAGQESQRLFASAQRVLTRYCAGCHNATEAGGEFRVDQLKELLEGGEHGRAITPGSAASSRMIAMMRGTFDPLMPPAGEPAPTADEIQLVAEWIEAGAAGPSGIQSRMEPVGFPKIPLDKPNAQRPVTALTVASSGGVGAWGCFQRVVMFDPRNGKTLHTVDTVPGKVTDLKFTRDGRYLLIGTGVTGVHGIALLYSVAEGRVIGSFGGHRDLIYSVAFSPDEKSIVTSSYDRTAQIWSLGNPVSTTQPMHVLRGHNDAVFDAEFSVDGKWVVTASADGTVKIWDPSTGKRVDTRGEPLKGQAAVVIGPNSEFMYAAGEDNRIRKWSLVSLRSNKVATLLLARFAHEAAIVKLHFHPNGTDLVSLDASGNIKIWSVEDLSELWTWSPADLNFSPTTALAFTKDQLLIGRPDSSFSAQIWPEAEIKAARLRQRLANRRFNDNGMASVRETPAESPAGNANGGSVEELQRESEPNDRVEQANLFSIPFRVSGTIDQDSSRASAQPVSHDLYRIQAERGQRLVLEARAKVFQAVSGKKAIQVGKRSPLDTKIEVLDERGNPVPRVLLQAVRDSYFTFRGKNSTQTGDFRIHNWEEMKLGQLLYCNGEVVRLFHYPRGPDSGFNVFPNFGNRHGVFDTTAMSHALHEPCYIVEPHPPGAVLPENGLPTFTLNYVNDDDAERELGTDSRLHFDPPTDGTYLVRVSDSRGLAGPEFQYQLSVRPRQPGFRCTRVIGEKPKLIPGGYRKVGVQVDRLDQFTGELTVEVENLPDGVTLVGPGPIRMQGDQLRAFFVLHANSKLAPAVATNKTKPGKKAQPDLSSGSPASVPARTSSATPGPEAVDASKVKPAMVVVRGIIGGQVIESRKPLGKITIGPPSSLVVSLMGEDQQDILLEPGGAQDNNRQLPILEVRPGSSVMAKVRVERNGYQKRINFGNENAAINAPFGVYVDDIGLNGVLVTPQETARSFRLTAEATVDPGEYLIFVEAAEAGKPSSNPVLLRVLSQ